MFASMPKLVGDTSDCTTVFLAPQNQKLSLVLSNLVFTANKSVHACFCDKCRMWCTLKMHCVM